MVLSPAARNTASRSTPTSGTWSARSSAPVPKAAGARRPRGQGFAPLATPQPRHPRARARRADPPGAGNARSHQRRDDRALSGCAQSPRGCLPRGICEEVYAAKGYLDGGAAGSLFKESTWVVELAGGRQADSMLWIGDRYPRLLCKFRLFRIWHDDAQALRIAYKLRTGCASFSEAVSTKNNSGQGD